MQVLSRDLEQTGSLSSSLSLILSIGKKAPDTCILLPLFLRNPNRLPELYVQSTSPTCHWDVCSPAPQSRIEVPRELSLTFWVPFTWNIWTSKIFPTSPTGAVALVGSLLFTRLALTQSVSMSSLCTECPLCQALCQILDIGW